VSVLALDIGIGHGVPQEKQHRDHLILVMEGVSDDVHHPKHPADAGRELWIDQRITVPRMLIGQRQDP